MHFMSLCCSNNSNPVASDKRAKFNFRTYLLGLCIGLLLLAPQSGRAAGTAAGTAAGSSISNVVTLTYVIGAGPPSTVNSSIVSFLVDEIIQPVLSWQDAAPVAVSTPGNNDVLTFLLTNSGNGTESFGLTRTNDPAPPPGNYTPLDGSIGSIYVESGLLAGFQATGANADTVYIAGGNDPTLSPDASLTIYLISNTPSNLPVNAGGNVLLTVSSLTPGTAGSPPGTSLAGLGQGGGFAVVGSSSAQAGTTGSYIASGVGFVMNKSVLSVLDLQGGVLVMPGAVLTYQIVASLSGAGTATNLVIVDPLPADTTYVPGSIVVDGIVKTDAADADNAQLISATRTVSVSLGNVAAPANVVITFRATIN
ncbi:MAG: hypothetical protein CO186_10790 [Zetaproteobacteria bacterium CG_4_9_14_3_um_filter_49_83]|nr:MAG: hypothetical protein AUJ56_09180 [Zetaproteobacteria bacterium CG1_02_49_23]PIQ33343.1 MAG: hypothetical protein COW62_05745 [Zetaproteobacteria bacterium CG17_big_fil_post_rev_8_21_14_2_50_50_13]PIV31052.1 MAG: hypothetical protein COS35_03355 [Zetaproteobacteria bacterium CG02_land_8_20_14_3_00_50_9]PIY57079.1 MAG: hypothetical protein COZ00_00925 [Zetaproteobacteria bacterium CG_4_10_14_0_8_um_filter_49_80]PJA34381.1 MAG: hypothetical protein CO186_10790 [Zetaproteobacteria bacterium